MISLLVFSIQGPAGEDGRPGRPGSEVSHLFILMAFEEEKGIAHGNMMLGC